MSKNWRKKKVPTKAIGEPEGDPEGGPRGGFQEDLKKAIIQVLKKGFKVLKKSWPRPLEILKERDLSRH